MPDPKGAAVSGRCYCGAVSISAGAALVVTYCHCTDCKRWTGAPAPAFAAFDPAFFRMTPEPQPKTFSEGVTRWCCPECGSPLAARFDYLPNQVYVPLGVLDEAEALPPSLHTHSESALSWLHISDGLPRVEGSGRAELL